MSEDNWVFQYDICKYLFFPQKDAVNIPSDGLTVVTIPSSTKDNNNNDEKSEEIRLRCFYRKQKNGYVLIHFHGNGELVSNYVAERDPLDPHPVFCDLLQEIGLSVFFAEYRGYGYSTGKPTLGDIMNDCKYIFETINVPQEKIILYGRSIGSIIAIHFASLYPKIAGLIIDSGFSDPLSWAQKRFTSKYEELNINDEFVQKGMVYLNHEEKIKKFLGRILIIHTKDDRVVPFAQAEQNFKWAKERKIPNAEEYVTFLPFEAGDHNYIWALNHKEMMIAVTEFAVKCGHKLPKEGGCNVA